MKALTITILTLLIVGGFGFVIIYPIMLQNIDNNVLFGNLLAAEKILGTMALIGMIGNVVRVVILSCQEKSNHK